MKTYKNIDGQSGVRAFEIEDDKIIVQFNNGSTYVYDYKSTGKANVEHMKTLAISGQGLNSFIRSVLKKNYAEKLR